MALNVTADSNIYISAVAFGGRPLRFLEAARAGVFHLAISNPLLEEIDPSFAINSAGRATNWRRP